MYYNRVTILFNYIYINFLAFKRKISHEYKSTPLKWRDECLSKSLIKIPINTFLDRFHEKKVFADEQEYLHPNQRFIERQMYRMEEVVDSITNVNRWNGATVLPGIYRTGPLLQVFVVPPLGFYIDFPKKKERKKGGGGEKKPIAKGNNF